MNILLHICCGPCAIFPLEQLLEEGHTVSGFFYNPNIHPLTEYMKRREGALQVAEHFGIPLIFCDEPLGATVFFRAVNGSEEQGTSGRCGICQTMRLVRTAAEAAARHCDAFTSSLLYSRYQDHNHLKEQGAAAAQLAMFFMNSGLSPEYVTRTGVVDMAPVVVTKDNVDTIPPADRW